MGPLFDTRPMEDLLISTGRKLAGERIFPWENFHGLLRRSWEGKAKKPGTPAEALWQESLQRGGAWGPPSPPSAKPPAPLADLNFSPPSPPARKGEKAFHFFAYPTLQFFDGRSAGLPFLQELPDPLTEITWGGWVEIDPQTARERGIEKGDLLILRSPHGEVKAPAYPYPAFPQGCWPCPSARGIRPRAPSSRASRKTR